MGGRVGERAGAAAASAAPSNAPPPRPVRVYAPVGTHRDLLAYLVRRLLENGANSSFVHQFSDPDVTAEDLAVDPRSVAGTPSTIATGLDLYGRSEEHTSELQSLMRISYAVFCL